MRAMAVFVMRACVGWIWRISKFRCLFDCCCWWPKNACVCFSFASVSCLSCCVRCSIYRMRRVYLCTQCVFRTLDLRAHAEVCECLHFGIAVCARRDRGEHFLAKLAAAHIYSSLCAFALGPRGMNANSSLGCGSSRERACRIKEREPP